MITETSAIRFGRTRLEFGIRRSPRRRTVSVVVDPEDGVLLTAPESVPIQKLNAVVEKKATWILERLRWVEQLEERLPPREYVSGETFLYLGRHYRLKVLRPRKLAEVKLVRGLLEVGPERSRLATQRPLAIRRALEAWYRERASDRISERVAVWMSELGVSEVGEVLLRAQQKRWASCDAAGNLRFNWRIVQAPMRLLDYVVAHELTHLIHADHTRTFWRKLGSVMADYEQRREQLRLMGPRLEW